MSRHEIHERKGLAGEHPAGDAGQIIFLVIFLIVWALDSFVLHYSTFLSNYVPFYIRWPLALVVLCLSGYLAKAALKIVFGETREKPVVIRKGVFGIVRHPVYLGSILFYLGLLLLNFSILAAVVWFLIIVFYYYIAKHEEKLLLQKFGAEYEKYLKEVPMFIPRF